MLDFAIFAVTFVLFLLVLVFYLYPGSKSQTTIPGMDPSDPKEGNLPDILQAGSLQIFLEKLYKQYGPISSFYMGTTLFVSLADPELYEQHKHVFDKPVELFSMYKPIINEKSVLIVNGAEGRKQHKELEKVLNETCLKKLEVICKLTEELVEKWKGLSAEQHIPMYKYMIALCMKIFTKTLFGNSFHEDKCVLDFSRTFEICWTELEARAGGSIPEVNSPQDIQFQEAAKRLKELMIKAAEDKDDKENIFNSLRKIGTLEQNIIDDAIIIVLKYYSVVAFLTWTIYFLALHDDVQEKVYEEIDNILINNSPVTDEALSNLSYLKQVLNECLRMANVEPWTARVLDTDVEIGGHIIPKKTPVIHALGVTLQDSKQWAVPKMFDPERFNIENVKARQQLAFQPFGFAGKRQCPGNKWTYVQVMTILTMICRNFKLSLVEGQMVTPYSRLITRPEEELWITIKKR
ncbi:cytochrome P450 20A1-like [Centruroides vittatus]|uniref:cytochrome P450 20A1-like n=1 Tax=Centruroides vittatus TaxID=120091 RepID=UPI00350F8A3B